MKSFEREELNTNELEQIGEFASFPAEDFKSVEEYINKNEEFRVNEIQPQSFVDNFDKNDKKNLKKDENIHRKINRNLENTINSNLASSSSLGSIATLTVTATVATGIIVTPLFNNKIDYGKLDLMNYKVVVSEQYNEELGNIDYQNGVYIYFDENLNEGYEAIITNTKTKENIDLDKEKDYVYFGNLTLSEYVFEVKIMNDDKVIDSYNLPIKTKGRYEYVPESAFEYLVTFNEDGTSNIYYYTLVNELLDNYTELSNELTLLDSEGNELKYSYQINDNILSIENIKEEKYGVMFSSFYKEDNNYYMFNKNIIPLTSLDSLSWNVELDLDKLKISFNEIIDSDIKVNVKYLDDETTEEFLINKETILSDNVANITLSKIRENIEIEIEGNFIKTESSEYFQDYKGNISRKVYDNKSIIQTLYSRLNLDRIEVHDENYSYYGSRDTKLYFDGFINEGDYLEIKISNQLGTILDTQENIIDISEPIIFTDLDTSTELTLEYILYDEQDKVLQENTYNFVNILPSEYTDLDFKLNHINPMDAYLSYNDDDTFNAYFYTDFTNNTPYDIYYQIKLSGADSGKEIYISTYDKVGAFENLSYEPYGVNYLTFLKQDLVHYTIGYKGNPSGTIYCQISDGYLEGMSMSADEIETKIYDVTMYSLIYSDLEITVTFNTGEIYKTTIPQNEIVENIFRLDLSSYEYENATIEVIGLLNFENYYKDYVEQNEQIKGNKYHLAIVSSEIYI